MRFFLLLSLCVMLTACYQSSSTAVVDVNLILINSPHAKKGEALVAEAQAILQYNLNVIEKKLASYKDTAQAKAWLLEAARQLQGQMDNLRAAVSNAMGATLYTEILAIGSVYDVVIAKGNVLVSKEKIEITAGVQERYNTATVTWPPLPQRIDNPTLPGDPAKTSAKTSAKTPVEKQKPKKK